MIKIKILIFITILKLFVMDTYCAEQGDLWKVNESKIDLAAKKVTGQSSSFIDWENSQTEELLNFDYWRLQRQERDKNPKWKTKLRDSKLIEPVGKLIQCVKICKIYRGVNAHFASYLSNIYEGDELQTHKDSYTWILLIDGTLMRLSPNSSITFNEINISKKKIFHFYRLNYGHIHWQHRQLGTIATQNMLETDQVFLPLMVKQANREYFQRKHYQKLSDEERMNFEITNNQGHIDQYQKLNEYLQENKEIALKKNSQVFISTPNVTILATNPIFDLFYEEGSKSFLRKLNKVSGLEDIAEYSKDFKVYFRGYSNRSDKEIQDNVWYEIDKSGKDLSENSDLNETFSRLDLLIKRIPSIQLAREIMLRKYYPYIFFPKQKITSELLATEYSARLWDDEFENELNLRLKFLIEYSRRVETTNLSSINRFYEARQHQSFDKSYTQFAFDMYLRFLKFKKTNHYRLVKEMTDAQYYAWMLRYGQKSISADSR